MSRGEHRVRCANCGNYFNCGDCIKTYCSNCSENGYNLKKEKRQVKPAQIETEKTDEALEYAERYKEKWRDRSVFYWVIRLLQEVVELIGALIGLHRDDPKHELNQIASTAINLRKKLSGKI